MLAIVSVRARPTELGVIVPVFPEVSFAVEFLEFRTHIETTEELDTIRDFDTRLDFDTTRESNFGKEH